MRIARWLVVAAAVAALAPLACTTTTFQSTWRAPEAKPLQMKGAKVVGVFLSKSAAVRRKGEDAMARELTARGAQGVPAYSVLTDDEAKDPEAAKAKLDSLGFSGAIVMRVVGRKTDIQYTPGVWVGPRYRHFWGYWRWGWGSVWEPQYLRAERVVKVETLVYSITQDELVWAGVSKTVDAGKVDDLVSDLAQALSKQLEKEGLLPRS
jgi:hypothetical protein